MIKENNKWKIDFNFLKDGKYMFEIIFYDIITDLNKFFEKCVNIIFLDLSNFNTSNVTNMKYMFNNCNKLKEIKGINNLITNKVESMEGMFSLCNEIEFLDLSNWDTSNVNNMEICLVYVIN